MSDNTNEEILEALKKQTKSNYVAGFIPAVVILLVVWFYPLKRASTSAGRDGQASSADSFAAVRAAQDRCDYDSALAIAQRIAAKYPNNPPVYIYLGNIALDLGDVQKAENYYSRAYQLYPSEENGKAVQAIRARLQNDRSNPTPH